jgi:hypothetical protein
MQLYNPENEITVERPNWGLIRTVKLNYKDITNVQQTTVGNKRARKKDVFRKYKDKFGSAKIVKIEYSEGSIFLLLCKNFLKIS